MSDHSNAPHCIVHIVESFGAGVLEVIGQLARDQLARGLDVHVVHSRRPDTPPDATLEQILPTGIKRHALRMSPGLSPWRDICSAISLYRKIASLQPDRLHLHSSKAGFLGRAVARLQGIHHKTLYSPHGWSFLRQDISNIQRYIFLSLERLGYLFGGHITACSIHELALAKNLIGTKNCTLLRNAVAIPSMAREPRHDNQIRILTVGRITEQKAPWNFAQLAREFSGENIQFRWIGDSQHPLCAKWFSEAPVVLTGLLDTHGVAAALRDADIFLLLSAWEGLPLALIEAQSVGLPALITPLPGCLEVVEPEVTGLVAETLEEMHSQLQRLILDTHLRQRLGSAARQRMEKNFGLSDYTERAWEIYTHLGRHDDA